MKTSLRNVLLPLVGILAAGALWWALSATVAHDLDVFAGVAATSVSDVWAVGRSGRSTLTEHWDGTAWTVVPSPNGNPDPPFSRRDPNQLLAAAALSPEDVWAVGYFYENDGFTQRTLILHWDGQADSFVVAGDLNAYGLHTHLRKRSLSKN